MYVYCVFVIVSDYMALVIKLTIALHACTHTHVPQREWTVLCSVVHYVFLVIYNGNPYGSKR